MEENEQLVLNWFSKLAGGHINLGTLSDFMKNTCRKWNIQFRKIDPRRSENIVLGINQDCLRKQKKVLVSYLDYDRAAYSLRHAKAHTNLQEMMQMIRILIDMDFCIDVCGCNNTDAALEMPSDYYDYIIGFGDMFRLAKERNPKAFTIMYMTENPYTVSKAGEQKRIDYFYERTGKRISFARTGKFYLENDELLADAVICLGEKKYYSNRAVQRVYPSAFKNPQYIENKNNKRISTNFLVFGVKGFVHKGNDLLLEVFRNHPEWTLYMCGREITEECKKLGLKLPDNVVECGFVDVESDKFLELVEICPFVLLPSCSEGMSTSLLTCMRHGQIPVTMRGTGMDELSEYCEYFEDYHIEALDSKLEELSNMEKDRIVEYSDRIYQYANDKFTLKSYTDRLRKCFEELNLQGRY